MDGGCMRRRVDKSRNFLKNARLFPQVEIFRCQKSRMASSKPLEPHHGFGFRPLSVV